MERYLRVLALQRVLYRCHDIYYLRHARSDGSLCAPASFDSKILKEQRRKGLIVHQRGHEVSAPRQELSLHSHQLKRIDDQLFNYKQ